MNTLHNQYPSDYTESDREQVQRDAVSDSSSLEIDHPELETDTIDSSLNPSKKSEEMVSAVSEQNITVEESTSVAEVNLEPAPPKANWIQRRIKVVTDTIEEWKWLRREIRAFPARTQQRMKEIEKHFMVYRLTFANLTYKAPRIEEEIQEVYDQIVNQIPQLEERTKKRSLFFQNLQTLRDLHQEWLKISEKQDHLIALLQKAPKGMDFYNRMQIIREQRRQEELRQKENQERIEAAYESLKKALSYVEHQCKDDEPIVYGNEVLTLEDAQKVWNEHITEILTMKDLKNASVETVLARIRSLEETIREYPTLSKQIQRVGERFSRLIALHDLLSSYGKRIIPQAEISRSSTIMYEQIPALWSTGQYHNLKIMLERVENFLNFYENTVELEVAIGERRRSGFTQGLAPSIIPGVGGLSPLIGLARVLVAAIDQRDRYMIGHSEKVARLAVDTGKKLAWSSGDLEFLEIAALLHDIGKISIPETILTKVKPLTSQEWKMIQMHPYYGAQIVKQMNVFNRIVPWIYHHQEHWDGTGYPDQLKKEDIPLASSIIAVAEAFTVMTAELPYRTAVTTEEALENLKESAGKQFAPEVVEAFVEGVVESTQEKSNNPQK
jgi:putative nucleotidyltransferase with HDIG domain